MKTAKRTPFKRLVWALLVAMVLGLSACGGGGGGGGTASGGSSGGITGSAG
ncbi:MAG: hypothetical protein WCC36_09105 [Gammaproteobacteria bacterium]